MNDAATYLDHFIITVRCFESKLATLRERGKAETRTSQRPTRTEIEIACQIGAAFKRDELSLHQDFLAELRELCILAKSPPPSVNAVDRTGAARDFDSAAESYGTDVRPGASRERLTGA